MSFLIKNEQREHLKLLREQSPEALIDFCKLALDFLSNGPNEKRYSVAAKKLDTTNEVIRSTIEALVSLLIDCTRFNVSETQFEQIKTIGFTPEHISVLWQFVTNKREYVDGILKHGYSSEYRFRDLEWRLEAKIASRCLLQQAVPIITMKIHVDTEQINENKDTLYAVTPKESLTRKEFLLQTDPNNLVHIISVLEQALLESKTHRTRNFVKTFQ